jgi:hypothetical protein
VTDLSISHARCVPREDYARLMQMLSYAHKANADLAKEVRRLQERLDGLD